MFVLPGRLGGDNAWDEQGARKPLLDAGGVRAAEAEGMEIGSHGLLHLDLTAADDVTLAAEAAESRSRLAEITGTAPGGFCYPYGAVDARTLLAVRRAGYAYACAVDPGALAGAFALPRTYVGERDGSPRLHAKRVLHRMRGARLAELPDPHPQPHPHPPHPHPPHPPRPPRPAQPQGHAGPPGPPAAQGRPAPHDPPVPPAPPSREDT